MNDYSFGNFVCQLREEKGLTQAELAYMLGVTAAAVSKWENGASKPKIEVLFSLAKILGVTPEELIEGRYLNGERVSEETAKRIREEFEYLTKVSSYQEVGVKVRRIISSVIDVITALLITYPITALFSSIFGAINTTGCYLNTLLIYLFNGTIPYIYLFLCDFLWMGRSLGKRIMGLVIVDKKTAKKASKLQTVIHNMFAALQVLDLIVLLFSGRTVGDYIAHTLVLRKKDLDTAPTERDEKEIVNQMENYVKDEYKRVFRDIFFVIISCIMIAVLVVLQYYSSDALCEMLSETKQGETAYEYLINSEDFKASACSEDEIILVDYMYSTLYENGKFVDYVIITYQMRWWERDVVCHENENGWYVCTQCTEFD